MLLLNQTPVTIQQFPDGTPKMDICPLKHQLKVGTSNIIQWRYTSDAELIQLYYLAKHLRNNHPDTKLILEMPYVPNARFDRVNDVTEVFTLKYFTDFINSMKFDEIYTLDVHSNVSKALINNIIDKNPTSYIEKVLEILIDFHGEENIIFFFPDEGAMKRYAGIANRFHTPYVFGMKNRDWKTGQILGLDIITPNNLNLTGETILIVDDICSKGGTYYHSAKKLKEFSPQDIYLYVSHCENTIFDGELLNTDLIKCIFTTNSILTKSHDKIRTFSV